jgi:serine/threonine protein phosphatase PrpC
MVSEAVLAATIRTYREPQQICDHLIAAANENGGADNITVVVVEVTGGWWDRLLNGVGGHLMRTLSRGAMRSSTSNDPRPH